MHKTIYFNNKPLILCTEKSKEIDAIIDKPGTVIFSEWNEANVDNIIASIQKIGIEAVVFIHKDVEQLLDTFKEKLKLVQAAGGLVYTENNKVLLIFRKRKWDLPKGKLDEGENLESCALREVEEETGLRNIILETPLVITYHTYYENNQLILKESHWYLMQGEEHQVFIPQLEEGIEKCEWVHLNKLAPYMENTHSSIIDVLRAGIQKLQATKEV